MTLREFMRQSNAQLDNIIAKAETERESDEEIGYSTKANERYYDNATLKGE